MKTFSKTAKAATLALLTAVASAGVQAKTWTVVEVGMAGVDEQGNTVLNLTKVRGNADFNPRNFMVTPELQKTALAVGLAALSSNRRISIRSTIDEVDTATHPVIDSIYMMKEISTSN